MCGRYNLQIDEGFWKRFDIEKKVWGVETHYNIAPSQNLPVVITQSPNQIKIMEWGLIPVWSKDRNPKLKPINAKAETLAEKPMFKRLYESQRCLIPATGFYEWKKIEGSKVPYHIRLKSQGYFGFAGLYDIWKSPLDEEIWSYCIITTSPNKLMADIHMRMPVILKKEDEEKWLNPDTTEFEHFNEFLIPYSDTEMEAYPISNMVNNPLHDDENVIKSVDI